MCGRFAITNDFEKLKAQFGAIAEFPALAPSYNLAPTRMAPVVVYNQEMQRRELQVMKWGLVPFWAKDAKIGNKQINARAETVAEKPAYKKSFADRRCIVPADGFFEWQTDTRQPYYITTRGGDRLGFAGIWDSWKTPEGERLQSFSIITGEPNELVRPVHDRMPVIIPPGDYLRWLSPSTSADDARSMLKTYPADDMQAWPVSKAVNNPRNDSPANLERLNSL